jgi:hypothetical protein
MMKTSEALQLYNEKEEAKKAAAKQKHEEAINKAKGIGAKIGSAAGEIA